MTQNTEALKKKNMRKFKNYLIHPSYQLRYAAWLAISAIALTVVNCLVFYFYIRENYNLLIEMMPLMPEVKQQLYSELWQIITILVGTSFVFICLISLLGLILSHRTAGALYHFRRVFTRVRDGHLETRVHLREKDDFQEVAQAFNEMMDKVVKK
jgi:signal transduction histidine kinase